MASLQVGTKGPASSLTSREREHCFVVVIG